MSKRKKKKTGRLPGMRPPKRREGMCVFCFGLRYLYERGAERLDYESEVEGLIAAFGTNGYTRLAEMSEENLHAALLEHADLYEHEEDEGRKRLASIIIAALERTWERGCQVA